MSTLKNYRTLLLVFLGSMIVGVGITTFGPLLWSGSLALHDNGLEGHSPVLIGVSAILGVISKVLYDWLKPPTTTNEARPPVSFRSLARGMGIATLLAPIFLVSLHKALADVSDTSLVFLLCYQNGFFFQTFSGKPA